jgi:hypothetical protein
MGVEVPAKPILDCLTYFLINASFLCISYTIYKMKVDYNLDIFGGNNVGFKLVQQCSTQKCT